MFSYLFVSIDPNLDTMRRKCRDLELNVLTDNKFHFKKTWFEFFVAISICNTVVVVDTNQSVDSAGSRDNDAFEDNFMSINSNYHEEANSEMMTDSNHKATDHHEPVVIFNNKNTVSKSPSVSSQSFRNNSVRKKNKLSKTASSASSESLKNGSVKSGSVKSNGKHNFHGHTINADNVVRTIERTPKLSKFIGVPKYESESPDEEALVKAAFQFGYKLKTRLSNAVGLQLPNNSNVHFEVLHTLPFDSARKRMSVIVRNPQGNIVLYCKGADSAILNRLAKSSGILNNFGFTLTFVHSMEGPSYL